MPVGPIREDLAAKVVEQKHSPDELKKLVLEYMTWDKRATKQLI